MLKCFEIYDFVSKPANLFVMRLESWLKIGAPAIYSFNFLQEHFHSGPVSFLDSRKREEGKKRRGEEEDEEEEKGKRRMMRDEEEEGKEEG